MMVQQDQEAFFAALQTVMGQVFAAAGYAIVDEPYQRQGGVLRYRRVMPGDTRLTVTYQLLAHTVHASRYRIMLEQAIGDTTQTIPLARLLWGDFGIRLLGSPDHWWAFNNDTERADTLLESGKLLAAYGLPWLDGSLPASRATGG